MGLHSGDCFSNVASHTVKQLLAMGSTRDRIEVELLRIAGTWPNLTRVTTFLNFVAVHTDSTPRLVCNRKCNFRRDLPSRLYVLSESGETLFAFRRTKIPI